MDDLCITCMCTGRNLISIAGTELQDIYLQMLNEPITRNLVEPYLHLCWECRAILKRFQRFKNQTQQCYAKLWRYAQEDLEESVVKHSHLQIQNVISISYNASEEGTHLESEMFVDEIKLEKKIQEKKQACKRKATSQKTPKEKIKKKENVKKEVKIKNERSLDSSDMDCNDPFVESDLASEFDCKVCDKIFHTQEELVMHTAEEHVVQVQTNGAKRTKSKEILPDKPQCVECGKMFSSRKTYRYHLNKGNECQAGPSGSKGRILTSTPRSTARVGEEAILDIKDSGRISPSSPFKTPQEASPQSSKRGMQSPTVRNTPSKSRRSLSFRENDIIDISYDSGTHDDTYEEEGDDESDIVDLVTLRKQARQMRNRTVLVGEEDWWKFILEWIRNDGTKTDVDDNNVSVTEIVMDVPVECERMDEELIDKNVGVESECDDKLRGTPASNGRRESGESARATPRSTARVDTNFSWSDDFISFSGQKEKYTRVPGPSFFSQDPVEIFCKIWDREFLELVVRETNSYAWEVISKFSDPDRSTSIPNYLNGWTELTVEELYGYFAILIHQSFCHRTKFRDYWTTGLLEMPKLRELMSRNRFVLISKFLRFSPNETLLTSGHHRKIQKVAPIVDHCNKRFKALYTPSQHLSLDESLLLWKGRLSWKQSIRSKASRFGIKSFELCEAETGYLLQYRLYTGKDTVQHPDPIYGFQNHTAKVVLDLVRDYLDVGHVIVMDNWYNQLPMTRYLKSRRTDVLGTLNRRRDLVPFAIKNLTPNVKRGTTVSRHCGDIALVAWKDVKLVTVISTYHKPEIVSGIRAGQPILKPTAVHEYNKYMGGVDLKDQKLSMYLLERKRNLGWYMKVFKRLFNTSLLNAYIIYTKNPMHQVYSHRDFRQKVAEGLLSRYPLVSSGLCKPRPAHLARLKPGNHFPIYTEPASEGQKARHKQLRCVRCTARNKRVVVTIMCGQCKAALCVGQCWLEYHTLEKL